MGHEIGSLGICRWPFRARNSSFPDCKWLFRSFGAWVSLIHIQQPAAFPLVLDIIQLPGPLVRHPCGVRIVFWSQGRPLPQAALGDQLGCSALPGDRQSRWLGTCPQGCLAVPLVLVLVALRTSEYDRISYRGLANLQKSFILWRW